MITKTQYILLDTLYDYYNKELFEGKLNDCMITTSRKKSANGFFSPESWKKKSENNLNLHEISINPDYLDREDEEWQSTLVHEMVHLRQKDFGKPSRNNYHNREWGDKMESLGLMPSNTGKPDGKKTGQGMTHYIISDGLFIKAFNRLSEKNIKYTSSLIPGGLAKASRAKTKYMCPCGNKVWGKPELIVICGVCKNKFLQAD